jgi:AraC family transcriptional regulator, glycine betaine-responsive activator
VKLQLECGCQLLPQTSASILDVAMACGFVSALHFTRYYRCVFGCMLTNERRSVLAAGDRRTSFS